MIRSNIEYLKRIEKHRREQKTEKLTTAAQQSHKLTEYDKDKEVKA